MSHNSMYWTTKTQLKNFLDTNELNKGKKGGGATVKALAKKYFGIRIIQSFSNSKTFQLMQKYHC